MDNLGSNSTKIPKEKAVFKGHQGAACAICASLTDIGAPIGTWAQLTLNRGLDFPNLPKSFVPHPQGRAQNL